MKPITIYLMTLALSAIFISTPSYCESNKGNSNQAYQVELIIFEHRNADLSNENFPQYSPSPQIDTAIELTDDNDLTIEATKPYQILSPERFHLQREANLIGKKEAFRLLLHTSWIQTFKNEQKVHLKSKYDEEDRNDNRRNKNNDTPSLDGWITIHKNHYYHVNLALSLTPADTSHAYRSALPTHFLLKDKRKLRASELHYIDHPKFGLLIQIEPLKSEN